MSDKETCREAIDEQALAAAVQNVYGPDTNLHVYAVSAYGTDIALV